MTLVTFRVKRIAAVERYGNKHGQIRRHNAAEMRKVWHYRLHENTRTRSTIYGVVIA